MYILHALLSTTLFYISDTIFIAHINKSSFKSHIKCTMWQLVSIYLSPELNYNSKVIKIKAFSALSGRFYSISIGKQ
jgi:hypothetical protein